MANKIDEPQKSKVWGDILAKAINRLRTCAVFGVGAVSTICAAWGTVLVLRVHMARGEGVDALTATLIGCVFVGALCVWLLCLATYHLFSHWRGTILPKAIRLNDAMDLLHAGTHKERLDAIKHYALRIFKTKDELPKGCSDNVKSKEVSTFMSPMFFNIDRLNAIGSAYYCCDYTQLQRIIAANNAKWGIGESKTDNSAGEIIALKHAVTDLQEKNTKIAGERLAATGRENQLKSQMEEAEIHMGILIELTNKVTNEFKPPRKINKAGIKAKYADIGKIYGIDKAPDKYVELFRKTMPKEIINWSGPSSQGEVNE